MTCQCKVEKLTVCAPPLTNLTANDIMEKKSHDGGHRMKQNKRNEQDNRTQNSSPYTPSAPYGSFMGDPRLAKMAEPKESPKKQRRSKIAAKITTIVGALLSLSVIAAVFVPMLRDHFASLPEDPVQPPITAPITPPVDPPIDPPVDPPIDPPSQPIDPPVEPEWEKAKLSFDRNHFKRKYTSAYNANLTIKYVYNQSSLVGLNNLLDRWTDVMLQSFQHNGKFVTFSSSSISSTKQIVKFFIFDGLCELRARKGADDTVSEQDCLDIIAYAADQISNFTYVLGNYAKLGDECSDVLLGLNRSTLNEVYEQSLQLQAIHTARQGSYGTIDDAIDSYSISVARAMVLLLFGYTHPVYDAVTSESEHQYRQMYFTYLNQSLDNNQMQIYTEQIAAIVREQFAQFHTHTIDYQHRDPVDCLDFIPFKMWQAVIDALPTMVEQTTGMSYSEFLTGGHMSPAWYIDLESRYNSYGSYTVQGTARHVYRDRLNALLAQLTFEPGDIRLTKQCEISYTEQIFPAFGGEQHLYLATNHTAISPELLFLPLFSAGYTETGSYYLQSSHYFAPLTEEQYKEFVAICSSETLASDVSDIRATIWFQIIGGAQP